MSTSPTEGGTPTGSNPAGVASPNPDQDSGSSARTELQSVSTDGDRRPTRGDLVDFDATPVTVGIPRQWRPARLNFVEEVKDRPGSFVVYGWFVPEHGQAVGELQCRGPGGWRWPEIPLGDPRRFDDGGGYSLLATQPQGEVLSEPEPLRCTAPITVAGEADDVEDECGAILGKDLHCQVCGGGLCYQHCAGVDHFAGRLVASGAAGMLLWKIVEVAVSRFRGQLYDTLLGGRLKILATSVGTSVDSVSEQIQWRIDQLVHQAERAAAAPAQMAVPLPILDFVERVPRGLPLGRDKRAELLHEVIEWLRGCDEAWDAFAAELRHEDQDTISLCRNEHNREIAELFSRLAGAL